MVRRGDGSARRRVQQSASWTCKGKLGVAGTDYLGASASGEWETGRPSWGIRTLRSRIARPSTSRIGELDLGLCDSEKPQPMIIAPNIASGHTFRARIIKCGPIRVLLKVGSSQRLTATSGSMVSRSSFTRQPRSTSPLPRSATLVQRQIQDSSSRRRRSRRSGRSRPRKTQP